MESSAAAATAATAAASCVAAAGRAGQAQVSSMTLVLLTALSWTLHLTIAASAAATGGDGAERQYTFNNDYDTHGGFGYGAGGYGLGDPSYLSDFDEEWAKMSGRIVRPKCVEIPENLTLCYKIGYTEMMLPNILQHDSLSEVIQQARSWVPLIGLQCHKDTKVFLCSLFSPVCLDRLIYPCRSLCESVRDNCLHRMIHYGFDWPEMLRCSNFPEDNDLCIKILNDVKPDNNCTACKQPLTYEAIIDNFCRSQWVMNVKIERMETQGADKGLVLSKKKRFYKADGVTKTERGTMAPVLEGGAECACDTVRTDGKTRYLLMGSKIEGKLVATYAVEFLRKNKVFRDALNDIRKPGVCENILGKLAEGESDKKTTTSPQNQDDGRCVACKLPTQTATVIENYCLADFVLRVSVKSVEAKDGHQTLVLQKRRKNYKKGGISKKEEKALEPVLEGAEGCKCELLENANKKARFLIFGTKHGERYTVNYVREFNNDKDLKNALKVMRKGDACLQIMQGANLGVDPPSPSSSSSSSSSTSPSTATPDKKDDKGKKAKGKKQKKGKKQGKGQKTKDKGDENGEEQKESENKNSNTKAKGKAKGKSKNDQSAGRPTPSPGQ